jgi:hypothetical protein
VTNINSNSFFGFLWYIFFVFLVVLWFFCHSYITWGSCISDDDTREVSDVLGLDVVVELTDVVVSIVVPVHGQLHEGFEAHIDSETGQTGSHIGLHCSLQHVQSVPDKEQRALSVLIRDSLVDGLQTPDNNSIRHVLDRRHIELLLREEESVLVVCV